MIVSELFARLGFVVNPAGANQFNAQLNQVAANANRVTSGIATGIGAAIGFNLTNLVTTLSSKIGMALAEIPKAGDEMNAAIAKIESSIGRSATSGAEAAKIYDTLYEIGQKTGIAANDSAMGFTRFHLAMESLNRPAEDTIKLLQGIQSAGVLAGASTQDITEVIRQLGQALGKGKLNGDELVSMSERMPRLMRDIQKQMGMTTAQFFDASSKGQLTPEKLIPALLTATQRNIEELANFPMSMGRAYAILTNSVKRFSAELDKQLGLSKRIADVYQAITMRLDAWRPGLSVVGDYITQLGGLDGILRVVEAGMIAAFGPTVLMGVIALGRALFAAFLPLTLFTAWTLLIMEFIAWVRGGKSLFGEKWGDFSEVTDKLNAQIDGFKNNFIAKIDEIIAKVTQMKNSFMDALPPAFRSYLGIETPDQRAASQSGAIDEMLGAGIGARTPQSRTNWLGDFMDKTRSDILESIFGKLVSTDTIPSDWAERRRNQGGFMIPDVSGKMPGTTASNVSQNNNISIPININAPAGDAASIGTTAGRGVTIATDGMVTRLGSSLAQGLGVSSPRIEAAVQ